jgi:hypothetical protein
MELLIHNGREEMSEEKKDFEVKDKRAFANEDQPEETTEDQSETAEQEADQDEADFQLPEINFPTFIFSLNSSALLNMGAIEDPGTGKKRKTCPWPSRPSTSSVCWRKKPRAT